MKFFRTFRLITSCSKSQMLFSYAILTWVLSLIARIKFNGLILGFDYGLFFPDGALYTFRALRFAGFTDYQAGFAISQWYEEHSFNAKYSPDALYGDNYRFLWDQYSTRVLYPLLSAAFVKYFGIAGMLVEPSLTLLFVYLATSQIALKFEQPYLGLICITWLSLSTSISRWMFSNTTDGLLLFFTTSFVLLIYNKGLHSLSRFQLIFIVLIIIGSSLTRFSALVWIGISLVFLYYKKRLQALLIAFISLLGTIPMFMKPFTGHILPEYNNRSLFERLLIYPFNLAKVLIFEFGQLYVLDRAFFFFILFTSLSSLIYIRTLSSQMFLVTLFSVFLTGAINGVVGVNFRYQLPVIPFMVWSFISTTPISIRRISRYFHEKS